MNCHNCGNELTGNFCSNCGQNSNTTRINFQYLINEIPNSIIQVNRGFLYTVKELFLRPGHTIRGFLNGKRKNHYRPVAFLIVTMTVYILVSYLTDNETFINGIFEGISSVITDSDNPIEFNPFIWIAKNEIYFTLLVIPFFALASYLAFLSSELNYFEHLVANFYITGLQFVIYAMLGSIFTEHDALIIIPFIIGFIYNSWAFIQIFKDKSALSKIGRIALTYVLFILQLFIIMMTITFIVR